MRLMDRPGSSLCTAWSFWPRKFNVRLVNWPSLPAYDLNASKANATNMTNPATRLRVLRQNSGRDVNGVMKLARGTLLFYIYLT